MPVKKYLYEGTAMLKFAFKFTWAFLNIFVFEIISTSIIIKAFFHLFGVNFTGFVFLLNPT